MFNKFSTKFLSNPLCIILILVLLSNLGLVTHFLEKSENPSNMSAEKLEYPYVDSGCKWSKLELNSFFENLNQKHEVDLKYYFYDHPSRLPCQGRPVISNVYDKTLSIGQTEILPIGIGVNPDFNNFLFFIKSILLFNLLIFFYNNKKLNKFDFSKLKIKPVLYLCIILLIYGLLVYPSIQNALSDILLYVFFGNILIFFLTEAYSFDVVFKSMVTLLIFPLFFYDSNISFWWLFLLVSINYLINNQLKINKFFIFITISVIANALININNFYFKKKMFIGEWILFSDGRHKGGIVDIYDGFQTLTYIFDILVLLFVFYILFKIYRVNYDNLEKDFSNSLINGYLIWIGAYFFSQIHPISNYYVYKIFGLHEKIDSIANIQPDGSNWRGITSSHELTGFWLLIIFCLALNKIINNTNKVIYVPLLVLLSASINFNSQRTVILLIVAYFIFLIIKNINTKNLLSLIFIFISLFTAFINNSESYNRLITRLENINFNFEINEDLRWQILQSTKRYEKYQLSIDQPSYEFNEVKNYYEFYSRELNTDNEYIIDSFSYLTKIFGREYQWFRYFYFTELTTQDLLFGRGPGQSHQHLVLLIEKPHSLYFSVLYQFGIFGVASILLLFFIILYKFIKSNFHYVYLLGLFFFITGIKAELIFTHNQFIFFICYMYYCFFIETKNKIKIDSSD